MKKIVLLIPIILALALGGAAADTPTPDLPAPDLAAILGTDATAPVLKAKPPRGETCPGAFDISRLADIYACTPEACNQWCVEDGGSYSIAEVWISWGICACKCCP
jgi:hypothetical protein